MKDLYALVDCNNFYVSCERSFQPALKGRPVIVLSNNDGCVIARSQEAKDLGVGMGDAYFKIKELLSRNKCRVFSSNFALYGDLSSRVMAILETLAPEVEIYSIDEAFIRLPKIKDPFEYGDMVRKTIEQATGIPVSVGIASSKTLAKLASYKAKEEGGIFYINPENREKVLKDYPIENLWGIGRRLAVKFNKQGVFNAFELSQSDRQWVLRNYPVPVLRTVNELKGTPCITLDRVSQSRKSICCSRSFKKGVLEKEQLEEAVLTFSSRAAEKLRAWKLYCGTVSLFIRTGPFSRGGSYSNGASMELPVATADSVEINAYVLKLFNRIFRQGYAYKKAGVVFMGLLPERSIQPDFFCEISRDKRMGLMGALDQINGEFGRDTIRFMGSGLTRSWETKREYLSRRYTTSWEELLNVR